MLKCLLSCLAILVAGKGQLKSKEDSEEEEEDESEMKGGLFRVVTQKQREKQAKKDIMNQEESSLYLPNEQRSIEEVNIFRILNPYPARELIQ